MGKKKKLEDGEIQKSDKSSPLFGRTSITPE